MNQNIEKQPNNNLIKRPPIVVIMGHVDHGKTSILDYIKKTRIAEKEAGGITQHIGAYEISHKTKDGNEQKITFIDTPGHEAFSKMRSRGAKTADVAVLVVAADEGFKPQTKEALNIIKAEKIPFVVAANKIDKPNINLEVIKKELGENEIYIEEWGGETPFVPVSAKTGDGINDLIETIILIADLENFTADENAAAEGVIIESHLDKRRGNSATLIITNGILKKGDYIVCGESHTSIKIFENFLGKNILSASFSSPVLIAGFSTLPQVGTPFKTFKTKTEAENYLHSAAKENKTKETEISQKKDENISLKIPLTLKADTAGSLEAVRGEILKLENENVKIDFLSEKTGEINEGDVKTASVNENSILIGFNVDINKSAKNLAERFSVKIQTFNIIYKLTEWLKNEIEEMAPIETTEEVVGKIETLKIFKTDIPRQIFGGRVMQGRIIKGGFLKSAGKFVPETSLPQTNFTGKIIELEKNKAKSDEVKEGSEFGAMAEVKKEIKEGNIFEIIERKTIKKKIY